MLKNLAFLAVGLIVLLVAALVVVSFYIDSIARTAIERGATYALGVETTLASADVGITSGKFSMAGLNVDNPSGFNTDHFLDLGEAGVQVSLGSLRSETVRLPVLRFDSLDVNIERKSGSTNVQGIMNNLKRFESTDESTKESKGGGKKFIIDEIDIRNVAIHVDALPMGGELSRINLPIEQIQLKNVGSDTKGGVLLSDLAGIIVKAIMAAAVEQGGDLIPQLLVVHKLAGFVYGEHQHREQIAGVGDFAVNGRFPPFSNNLLHHLVKCCRRSVAQAIVGGGHPVGQ